MFSHFKASELQLWLRSIVFAAELSCLSHSHWPEESWLNEGWYETSKIWKMFVFFPFLDSRDEGEGRTPELVRRQVHLHWRGEVVTQTHSHASLRQTKATIPTWMMHSWPFFCFVCVFRWSPWSRWWRWQPSCLSATETRCTATSSASAVRPLLLFLTLYFCYVFRHGHTHTHTHLGKLERESVSQDAISQKSSRRRHGVIAAAESRADNSRDWSVKADCQSITPTSLYLCTHTHTNTDTTS